MEITVLIDQMIHLFLLITLGYGLYKVNILNEVLNKGLSTLILKVSMPCLIVSSFMSLESDKNAMDVVYVFLVAIILYVCILPFVAKVMNRLLRVRKQEDGVYRFMNVYSNVGFMGFPIIQSIFSIDAMFYAVIINIVFNISMFTYGRTLMDKKGGKERIRAIIKSPLIIVSSITIVLYILQVQLPSVVLYSVDSIGALTTPLAMLILGASLASMPVRDVFAGKKIYLYVLVRQLLIPLGVYFAFSWCITDLLLRGVLLIVLAMPVANSCVLFATQYDQNVALTSKVVFLSTVFSMFSIVGITYFMLS